MATLAQNITTVAITVRALEACELVPVGLPVRTLATTIGTLPANTFNRVAAVSHGTAWPTADLFRGTSESVDDFLAGIDRGHVTGTPETAATLEALGHVERPEPLFLDELAPHPASWRPSVGRLSPAGLAILLHATVAPPVLPEATWQFMADTTEQLLGIADTAPKDPQVAGPYAELLTRCRLAWAWCCATVLPSIARRIRTDVGVFSLHAATAEQDPGAETILRLEHAADCFLRAGEHGWHRLTETLLGKRWLQRAGIVAATGMGGDPLAMTTAAIRAFESSGYQPGRGHARQHYASLLLAQPVALYDTPETLRGHFESAIAIFEKGWRYRDAAEAHRHWIRTQPTLVSPEEKEATLGHLQRLGAILGDRDLVADFLMEQNKWDRAATICAEHPQDLARYYARRTVEDLDLSPAQRIAYWQKAIAARAEIGQPDVDGQEILAQLLFEVPDRVPELVVALDTLAARTAQASQDTPEATRYWRWLAVEGRIYDTVRALVMNHIEFGSFLRLLATRVFQQETDASDWVIAAHEALSLALATLNKAIEPSARLEPWPELHRELAALHLHLASERALPGSVAPPIPDPLPVRGTAQPSLWALAAIFAAIAEGDFTRASYFPVQFLTSGITPFDMAKVLFEEQCYRLAARALRAHLADQPAAREPDNQALTGA